MTSDDWMGSEARGLHPKTPRGAHLFVRHAVRTSASEELAPPLGPLRFDHRSAIRVSDIAVMYALATFVAPAYVAGPTLLS